MVKTSYQNRLIGSMGKIALPLVACLLLGYSIGFAAPITNMDAEATATGIVLGSHGNSYYVENKPNDNFTIGAQYSNWDTLDMSDLYGQFNLTDNHLRAIIGKRIFKDTNSSRTYIGGAINDELSPDWVGYTSVIAGEGFQELQVGATYRISDNYDLAFNYRALRYEGNKNDTSIGLIFKF